MGEGMTALHAAAQAGRADVVRFLLEKGANPEIVDGNGKKAIDLIATAGRGGGAPPPPAAAAGGAAGRGGAGATPAAGAGGRGGAGGGGVSPAAIAEIREMLQNTASKK